MYRVDLTRPVQNVEHGKAVSYLPPWPVQGRSTARQTPGKRHGEDRRSQGRRVMRRICPRRSGLEWQESLWNRLKPGNANDERRQSLGASRSCRPRERSVNGHMRVLPSCLMQLGCEKMHRLYRATEHFTIEMFLTRLEPCEGKLSRTVLRGAWAG